MLLGPALDAPIDEWDRMVALNVQGLLYVTHAALPHLSAWAPMLLALALCWVAAALPGPGRGGGVRGTGRPAADA